MDLPRFAWGVALALSLALAAGVSWWLARGFPKGRIRRVARIVLVLVFGVMFLRPLSSGLSDPIDEGRWLCLLCGDQERQTRYAGFVLQRNSEESDLASSTTEFKRWYAREISGPHEHERVPVGCHWVGSSTVACTCYEGGSYFAVLPRVTDPELAAEMVERVSRTAPGERRSLLSSVEDEDGPFARILAGEAMTAEAFRASFADWLELHPEWR